MASRIVARTPERARAGGCDAHATSRGRRGHGGHCGGGRLVRSGTSAATEDGIAAHAVGRAGPAGHLDQRVRHPLQRAARYGTREFFTEEERAELDKERLALLGRDRRVERGTELDVAGAYNSVFMSMKRTGRRTSLIVDPPDGRVPPTDTGRAADERQPTASSASRCCNRRKRARASRRLRRRQVRSDDPRRAGPRRSTRYNTARMNRHNGPEDGSLSDRCLAGGIPEFGSGVRRELPPDRPDAGRRLHLLRRRSGPGIPAQHRHERQPAPARARVRQWHGDSRGRWEGDTLVVDVTNFSAKTDFMGSRENLHLVERWTRTGPRHARVRRHDRGSRPCGRAPGP